MGDELLLIPAAAFAVAAMSTISRRSGINAPVVLLLGGITLSFLPIVPDVHVDPELVLLTLLPPILYAAGVGMSWRGFRTNLRQILLLAIGCVVFTASAVAGLLHTLFGWPLALGFLLGAVVSPPDAVAPAAILRSMPVPRRIKTILEGESLINDATALVAITFALAALTTGEFSLGKASLTFVTIAVSELAYGLAVGWALLRARHIATDPRVEVLLALAIPYLAFWPPHALGGSGVIAVVVAGLWVSWNGRREIPPETRLLGYFIWDLVIWTVEATAFLLTGLQAKELTRAMNGLDWLHAVEVSVVTLAIIVVVRFIWVFPATYLPRLISSIRQREAKPHPRLPFFIASAGIRGVISMIAALSIPLTLNGAPFPERDTILFATFVTIVATMLGLGSVLRPIAGAIGLVRSGIAERKSDTRSERAVRHDGIVAVLSTLESVRAEGCLDDEVAALTRRHTDRLSQLEAVTSPTGDCTRSSGTLQLRLLAVERDLIDRAYLEGRLTDAARRRIEREFDLEEARVHHALESTGSTH